MYSPTTRLLTVLALLQAYPQMTGAELARRLEVDIRTVRRYITSLQDMGVPVEGERGPLGAYSLGRGAKMPPLMFTDEEAVALALGLRALREFQFPVEVAAIESALAKTERVLPAKLMHQIRGLQEALIFNISPYGIPLNTFHQNDLIATLGYAVQTHHSVNLTYVSWKDSVSERVFDPYGIVYNDGYWYTVGYCHLRHAMRIFRLDRIEALAFTGGIFERPADFDMREYVLTSIAQVRGKYQIEILFGTSLEEVQKLIPPFVGILETCEKGILFRHRTSRLDWVAHLLLSFDCPVFIRQPGELHDVLKQFGTRVRDMMANHS